MSDIRTLIESIDAIEQLVSNNINEDLDEQDAQNTYELLCNGDMSYEEFLDWGCSVRAAAKREVE